MQKVQWSVLEGGVHLSFTDIPKIFNQVLFPWLDAQILVVCFFLCVTESFQWYLRRGLGFKGGISPEKAIEEINR